jgi:hypothetical protein
MSYCVSMNNTEEIHVLVQREVAQLHQSIGGLLDRIESLEKQKKCLIKVGVEKSANLTSLRKSFMRRWMKQNFRRKGIT